MEETFRFLKSVGLCILALTQAGELRTAAIGIVFREYFFSPSRDLFERLASTHQCDSNGDPC